MPFTRLVAALAPLTLACLTSISRTVDYRHHNVDVIVGALLGCVMSYMVFAAHQQPQTQLLLDRLRRLKQG